MSHEIYLSGDGRMGRLLQELLTTSDPSAQGLTSCQTLDDAAAVVDFSHPDWTGPLLEHLLPRPLPLVVGTTALTEEIEGMLDRLSTKVPVLVAANTGTGINVLLDLVKNAASALGKTWDIEILEAHHRDKIDAPSGTAWMLLDAAAEATGSPPGHGRERAVPSRLGETGARSSGSIGVQSIRGGDIVGKHSVLLIGQGEQITLTHQATDRRTFARGALRAVHWLLEPNRPPGRYTMGDVLGLSRGED